MCDLSKKFLTSLSRVELSRGRKGSGPCGISAESFLASSWARSLPTMPSCPGTKDKYLTILLYCVPAAYIVEL